MEQPKNKAAIYKSINHFGNRSCWIHWTFGHSGYEANRAGNRRRYDLATANVWKTRKDAWFDSRFGEGEKPEGASQEVVSTVQRTKLACIGPNYWTS